MLNESQKISLTVLVKRRKASVGKGGVRMGKEAVGRASLVKLLTFHYDSCDSIANTLNSSSLFFPFSIQRLIYLENISSAKMLNLSLPSLKILQLKSCSLFKSLSYKGSDCFLQEQL